jgi:hypothetical protein
MLISSFSKEDKAHAFKDIVSKADRFTSFALVAYFVFGLGIATFYGTYFVAVVVGLLCLMAYFGTKVLMPNTRLYQYVLGVVLAIFTIHLPNAWLIRNAFFCFCRVYVTHRLSKLALAVATYHCSGGAPRIIRLFAICWQFTNILYSVSLHGLVDLCDSRCIGCGNRGNLWLVVIPI